MMKTIKLFVAGLLLLFATTAESQISVSINLGTPPQWGPVGYTDVRYYYLPDVEAYYDVPSSMFIYFNGVNWIHRSYLPSRYRNYDLYNGYKVVMTDYRGNTPYTNFREYRTKYAKGYRGQPQKNYGERPEHRSSNEREYSKGHDNQNYKSGRGSEKHGNPNSRNSNRAHGNGKKK
jgi:hypothetical protein